MKTVHEEPSRKCLYAIRIHKGAWNENENPQIPMASSLTTLPPWIVILRLPENVDPSTLRQ